MQKISPFLWFDDKAEEALNFYASVFKHTKIKSLHRYGNEVPGKAGQVMTGVIEIEGMDFMALNAGPQFTFNPAISFFVNCETQEEVDELWEKLSAGGRKDRCGWLVDPFGISWQIIPTLLGKLMYDADPVRSGRVMQAMLQMDKIDMAALQKAYDGE